MCNFYKFITFPLTCLFVSEFFFQKASGWSHGDVPQFVDYRLTIFGQEGGAGQDISV